MSSAKRKERVECHHCSSKPGHLSSWQILDFPKYIQPQSSWPKLPTRRKWVFQAYVGHLGALQTCPGGWLNQWSHLRKWNMWLSSDDHKEACGADLLPFSPWRTRSACGFTGHCSLFFWAAVMRNTVQGEWCVVAWAPSLSPALPLLLCPASVLPQGHYPFTTDLLAAPFCEEVVLVTSAAAIYKDFTAPGLGTVEVPHLLLMTGTWECWVQADARPRRCWNGRGNGSIMRWS